MILINGDHILEALEGYLPIDSQANVLASSKPIHLERIHFCSGCVKAENYKKIPQKDLILYTHLKYKTRRFFNLLKGNINDLHKQE